MKDKLNTKKYILIFLGLLVVGGIILIIIYKNANPQIENKELFTNLVIYILIAILLAILIYWMLWKMSFKTGKEIVPTVIVEKILKEMIALEYNIPVYPPDKNGYCLLINQKDIQTFNHCRFFYKNTSIPFFKLDVFIRKLGERRVYTVQIDEGEKFIRENYQMSMLNHKTHNTVDYERNTYPLATPQAWQEQLLGALSERREQGEDTSSIEQMLTRSSNEQEQQLAPQSGYVPPSMPVSTGKEENDVSKQMAEDYEEDIEKYKNNNR